MKVANQKIRIRLKGYDREIVDQSQAHRRYRSEDRCQGRSHPAADGRSLFTVVKGPHVDKDSREQFEMRTHKRLIRHPRAPPNSGLLMRLDLTAST